MPIPVLCPCKAKLKVADHLLDGQIKCPQCGKEQGVSAPGPDHPYFNLYTPSARNGSPVAFLSSATPEQVLKESPLSEEERSRVENELDDKERLIWTGRPDPKIAFGRGWILSIGMYAGALMLLVVLIVLLFVLPGKSLLFVMLPLGALFLGLIGCGTFYPYYQRWLANKQFYTITDKRATVWGCDKFGQKTRPSHYTPAALSGMRRLPAKTWGPDAGDLVFKSHTKVVKSKGDTIATTTVWGFLMLRNAVEPEKIIREVLLDPLLDKIYE